jgi:hypothetical protein
VRALEVREENLIFVNDLLIVARRYANLAQLRSQTQVPKTSASEGRDDVAWRDQNPVTARGKAYGGSKEQFQRGLTIDLETWILASLDRRFIRS